MNLSSKDRRLQIRLMGAVLAFSLAKDMFTAGLWVLSAQSLTGRVAQLAIYPKALAFGWIILAALVLPYFFMQIFDWFEDYRARLTRLACRSILAGGVLWIFLGYLSRDLDYKYITVIFMITGLVNIAMSTILAISLNAAQRQSSRIEKETDV